MENLTPNSASYQRIGRTLIQGCGFPLNRIT
jgi:hypothetical protein